MTKKRYLSSSELQCDSVVTMIGVVSGATIVRLSSTLFHPKGGGQPGDKGFIGSQRVFDTRHSGDGEVDHFVDNVGDLVVGISTPIFVDADYRLQNARLHSAGHLIADAVHKLCPQLVAVGGHHWKGEARVEFEGVNPSDPEFVERLEDELARCVQAANSVEVIGDPFASRQVRIGDGAPVPCGGTHVSHLGEIGKISIKSARVKGGKLRVSYDVD